MRALARSMDWRDTAVGDVGTWPQSLRTALSVVFESKFPMLLCWSRDFIQFYNDPFRPILGANKHPAFGKSTQDTFSEAWHIVGPLFAQVMEGNAVGFEDMLVPLDRNGFLEECYFHYSYSPIRIESGEVGGIVVTCMETTRRVIAERRLRTLRELASLAALAHAEADAWQAAAAVLRDNAADVPFSIFYALDAAGAHAAVVSASIPALAPPEIRADDAGAPWPLFATAGAASLHVVSDVRRRFGDHAGPAWPESIESAVILPITRPGLRQPYGFLVAGISPRLTLDDNYQDFLSLVADQVATALANARAYEEERRRTQALVELDRQKSAFFSNVSHEFRTPLTLMLAPLEEALAKSPARLDARDVEVVHRNAIRLLRLVNTLLDFSRLEAGRDQAVFEETDLAALTRELAGTFESLMEQGGLRFEVDCPPLSRPAVVDRLMWEKIVLNLLSNAFKFTLRGSVRIALREQGGSVELRVEDTGAGIPAAELPRVFDRFHRVATTRSRTFEGSGIGLALVRDLARLHGGEVRVDSVDGRGSTFTVTVPMQPAGAIAPARASGADTAAAAARAYVEEAQRWTVDAAPDDAAPVDAAMSSNPPARLLLVDDNADMRDYLKRLFADRWIVDVASNGREALARIEAAPPDLIVTDVMMPEMNGLELLQEVRRLPSTRMTPVIMLSARSGEEARLAGLEAGADDYVIKPFSSRELIARVRTQLELSALRRDTAAQNDRLVAMIGEIDDARRSAESANRAKDEFLAMLSHELRNPLAPIITALQLMRMRGDQSAGAERDIIERQVRHVVRLVDDLLDVSRIATGKIELQRERVDLPAIAARAIERAGPIIAQKQHQIEVEIPEGLVVDGDPTRLSQVLFNLVYNAATYSEPRGSIRVAGAARGDRIELRVRDSGIGIDSAMLPHVFDLFIQERQALDRSQGGLGLGLAIVRNLVELHGGEVAAFSEGRGRGSEFVVWLPAAAGAQRPAADDGRQSPARQL